MSLGSEVLEFYNAEETDEFGDPIPGDESLLFRIEGCAVYPHTSEEDNNRAATITTHRVGLIPPSAHEITESLEVEWRGRRYEVDGEPGPWIFLDGEDAGTQILMRRAAH